MQVYHQFIKIFVLSYLDFYYLDFLHVVKKKLCKGYERNHNIIECVCGGGEGYQEFRTP